ncbi:MAG: L-serine ammonia-lyase, iron-sulfur-dependent, subunit alpha [Anaerococcus sp.]|uniref:L-serine ammonia-lyase, iron-sulfur-dependent, subunit alpha n=1 Tax=Anaerococcus sp. TaxID=1872515 RepID=UPI002A7DBED8|nr:L-serine ammonia-lyase, iron-sulfur-dependent, subunit alpha [Anaerococcus sp.]MDD7463597.1 L-serine ammonia-lyase, iron-sulfur-dependent, subunit alpha [Peptoniphilaceae bacterium]MDY3055359.1 L-serine ammonia-lyase, iron-sulfur-dependent, subunit alpha [Anaerococcus sp.]MDY6126825.1 L-serine ammonia-lyase, iron-sulfur-dependent, subunit alpha [Anaerococcus sp.]
MKITMKSIKERCKNENKEIWEIALEDEMELSKKSKEEVFDRLQRALDVMKSSATAALDKDVRSMTGMSGGNAKVMNDYFLSGDTILGDTATSAMAMAFSTSEVNASMGKIVASPTAGSAGILPATLMAMRNKYKYSDEELNKAILVASEIGQVIADSATFAGAEGGCQAECGSASAMAAAAICYLRGGDIEAQENAASIALLIILGLVCDPIGGMVEFPCNLRNASGVINAMAAADMAMAGVHMFVGFDECVETMKEVGDSLPSTLRETGEGGIAVCESALRLKAKYIDKTEE